MNYYRRFMGDYQGDTGHLSLAEHGAYNVLLDHYYSTEGELPTDLGALRRLCRAANKAEADAVRVVADAYFPVVEGQRRNARADREIAGYHEFTEQQRAAGKASAAKRAANRRSNDGSTDVPTAVQPPLPLDGSRRSTAVPTTAPTGVPTSISTPISTASQTSRSSPLSGGKTTKNGRSGADPEREREAPAAIAGRRDDPEAAAALARIGAAAPKVTL